MKPNQGTMPPMKVANVNINNGSQFSILLHLSERLSRLLHSLSMSKLDFISLLIFTHSNQSNPILLTSPSSRSSLKVEATQFSISSSRQLRKPIPMPDYHSNEDHMLYCNDALMYHHSQHSHRQYIR